MEEENSTFEVFKFSISFSYCFEFLDFAVQSFSHCIVEVFDHCIDYPADVVFEPGYDFAYLIYFRPDCMATPLGKQDECILFCVFSK